MTEHLIIFARYPELGKVKTRLAAELGAPAALAVYEELLGHTRSAVQGLAAEKTVWLAAMPSDDVPALWPECTQQVQLPVSDLGQRMAHAFAAAFAAGATRVVIIGTDCPGLTSDLLQEAFQQLHEHEVVLGPAHDGGYYLLGMRRLEPALFEGIEWSTDAVLRDTLWIAERQGLSVALLPLLRDVDTADDWRAWQAAAAL